jgi:thiol-disulfide isomerase/thioredoxin
MADWIPGASTKEYSMKFISLLSVGFLSLAVGCGSPGAGSDDPENRNPDVTDPGGMMDNVDYPKGNLGFGIGQQIANLSFLWYKTGLPEVGADPQKVRLSDIYAMRKQGAKLLQISGAAVWCGPCNSEADALGRVLKDPTFKSYLDQKGNPLVVVQVVLQKKDGSPSDRTTLQEWVNMHKIDTFSVGIDPADQVGQYTPANFLPRNVYVQLSDMTIIAQEPGSPSEDAALVTKLKSLIERAK